MNYTELHSVIRLGCRLGLRAVSPDPIRQSEDPALFLSIPGPDLKELILVNTCIDIKSKYKSKQTLKVVVR